MEFVTGIKDKYPSYLLKGRIAIEGNVVSCMFKDMLLLDEVELEADNFLTADGRFYFSMLSNLRAKGFYNLDEVTILSNLPEDVVERYEECGGWDTIQNQIDIINEKNFDTYLDILYRENIIIKMYNDGFNLLNIIEVENGKKVTPLKLFKKMTAEQVIDWYEARLSSYGNGYSSKILEEEEIDFDDEFINDCMTGEENGVPFDIAGIDNNLEDINCFPFLSRQMGGIREGTTVMMGGFSSSGKSSWFVTIVMALLYRDRKFLIISNEESIKKFKIKFMVWLLYKRNRYYKLSKRKMQNGDIDDESRAQLKDVQDYWRENFKGRVKFISIVDADMTIVKKKIRENVLRYGYDAVLYDTFKIQSTDYEGNRQDLSLVRDSRELDKIAKKYNIIMLASVQLAEHTRGTLALTAQSISGAKAIKEILEGLLLMRPVYNDIEFDKKSKYYCHPFKLEKVNDKWIKKEVEPDPDKTWRIIFVNKNRNGQDYDGTGEAFLVQYLGDYSVFKEKYYCRPAHGRIE